MRCFPIGSAGDNIIASIHEYRELFPEDVFIDAYPPNIEVEISDTGGMENGASETDLTNDDTLYVWLENPPPPVPIIPGFHRQVPRPHISALSPILCSFPNPFNAETKIMYCIFRDEAMDVNISIYDIQGTKIATIVDEAQTPGNHSIIWDGADNNGNRLVSGVYLVRIESCHRTFIHKVFLVK